MAYKRSVAAGEHCRQLARAGNLNRMPDDEHAAVETMKRSAAHPSRNPAGTDADGVQLPGGDKAELTARDPSECVVITPTTGARKLTEFRRRDELDDISTPSDSLWPRSTGAGDSGEF